MADSPEPMACTAAPDDAAQQGVVWAELRRHALTITRIDGGAALTFEADLADRVEDWAAREASCCGFLSIATVRSDDTVRLAITADNPAVRPVIEAMAAVGSR